MREDERPDGHKEQSLKETAERLRLLEALLDRVPDFFYVHDSELRFQYANQAAADYFKRAKEDLPGRLHREVDDDPEQAAFFEQLLIPIIERGEAVETDDVPYRRPDGSSGLLQAFILPFDHPNTGRRMMLGISRDVTEQRQLAAEREAKAAYERELEIAQRVQRSILPASAPAVAGFDLAARCEPAAFAGGDLYDFIDCGEGRLIVVMGDVSGHGVGPAIVASACRAYARALLPRLGLSKGLQALDAALSEDCPADSFVTLALVELQVQRQSVSFCSAGQGPVVVLRRDGQLQQLPTQTPPLGLGLVDDADTIEVQLEAGDGLLIPSDGLIESANREGHQRGIDSLAASCVSGNAAQRVAAAFQSDEAWRDGGEPDDDRTLIVLLCSEHDSVT